ncbi:MAG: hypothetical protein L0H25_05300, partial [Micrococcales bacterium]|nr:hypothetical protein [Micrococcales bacterium]
MAAAVASMVDMARLLATGFPTWSLPETAIGQVIGQAQLLAEAAHTLSAVLTGEAHQRGLGASEGLSRPDWLKTAAPGLDG